MFSRAFLNFNSPEAVFDFKARFDGHVFVSTRGTQYRCSVEYAPFQKVPTAHPKKLAMEGTIDKGRLTCSKHPEIRQQAPTQGMITAVNAADATLYLQDLHQLIILQRHAHDLLPLDYQCIGCPAEPHLLQCFPAALRHCFLL
jgi:hypothetical protein